MIHIPNEQIQAPSFHADDIGFVFKWEGHLLRGIYPDAVERAKQYFQTGFIDEVVERRLFPRTWISDFENEQFGLIIEHELIEPTTYATEWNFEMLKDAALMVLDIAQIGLKYGFNMIDCHKLNVMFKNNRPLFVDLGSFVPQEIGCSGWMPYNSFLCSYYYILDLWSSGCPQLAKRMMAPHVELQHDDYWAYKNSLYRHFNSLLRFRNYSAQALQTVSMSKETSLSGTKLLAKRIIDGLRLSDSQNLNRIHKRILKKNLPELKEKYFIELDWISEFIHESKVIETVTFINVGNLSNSSLDRLTIKKTISINSNDTISGQEYRDLYDNDCSMQSLCFDAYIPTFTHSKEPESRFRSDMVIIGNIDASDNKWSIHNAIVKIKSCELYSLSGYLGICLKDAEKLIRLLSNNYSIVKQVPNRGVILKVK